MNKSEIIKLLKARNQEQDELFRTARELRNNEFGNLAYIRAIIEPSNNCRNNCHYCAMRKDGKSIKRYRMNADEISRTAEQMIEQNIKVFSLETGEDPEIIDAIVKSAQLIKKRGGWILGAFGNLEKEDYKKLKDAGIDAYLLKFETSDAELFSRLRPGTTLQKRLENLEYLKEIGFAIATGNIVGLPGQTIESIANDVLLVKSLDPFMATVSPLISSPGTPMEKQTCGNIDLTLNTLAIYRLLLPKSHIPALCALNFYPGVGQLGALNAGANDVLINTAKPNSAAYNFAIYSTDKKCVSLEAGFEAIRKTGLKFDSSQNYPY